MKSLLYLLTALLPLALALPSAEPDADADALEEKHKLSKQGNKCHADHNFDYYKYPCKNGNYKKGSYHKGDKVDWKCKYYDWYQTSEGWWTTATKNAKSEN
ncbi:hypothetical protein BBP40_004838 [Aspergillus hancockii]|nr:hypothetical protein BBP40_004838 [Aspergillus hancockii]